MLPVILKLYEVPPVVFVTMAMDPAVPTISIKPATDTEAPAASAMVPPGLTLYVPADEIKTVLANKKTLLSGHSGVGKSTFINAIFPDLDLRTQEVSDWSGKGLHTTTFAEMFDLPFGGKIIDTPGIRELGLVGITKQELSGYFPEMKALVNDCQFNNCMHINEPGCAVKKAINDGLIAIDRYVSYMSILDTMNDKKY